MIGCPGTAGFGVTAVILGVRDEISIGKPVDVPPPGVEVITVTVCLPSGNGCGRGAVNCVDDTYVVVRLRVPTLIVEVLTKCDPVTVSTTLV